MRTLFLVVVFVLISAGVYAQGGSEKPKPGWHNTATGNMSFTQNAFDNWAQGGENSWSWQTDINSSAIHEQEKYQWSSAGKLSFGNTRVDKQDSRKSADELRLETVLTYRQNLYINPYVAANALTQLTKGYDYSTANKIEISNFIDPGYFSQSAGIGYQPRKEVKTRLGAAMRETVTRDHPVPFADKPGTAKIEKTKAEFGGESVTDLNTRLGENLVLTSNLALFFNGKRVNETDVNWDNVFTSKISKYINVNFNVKMLYDRNVSKKRQLKQVLAVGLSYVLF